MKKVKEALAIWMIALLVFVIPVSAAQSANLIRDVKVDGTEMTIMCTDTEENGSYEVSLDSSSLEFVSENIADANTPVTVFCLVDNSGSMSDLKLRLVRDTLTQISNSMREGDSMVIAEVNDDLTIGNPLSSVEDREVTIQSITASHKDTDLYMGVVKSLEQLVSNENYNPCRCLVVLSDGEECQDDGMTEQEVLTAIEKSRLPVYTVALPESSAEVSGAKILGSFARSSFGGFHLTTVGDGGSEQIRTDVSGTEFGAAIWDSLMSTLLLKVDLSEVQLDRTKVETRLSVVYQSGSNTYTDYVDLNTNDFPVIQATPDVLEDPDSEDLEQSDVEKESETLSTGVIVGIILAVIAVILILVIVILKARKKQPEEIGMTVADNEEKLTETQAVPETRAETKPETKPEQPYVREYSVYMTDIPYGEREYHFTVPEGKKVTFGRDKRADYILDPKDSSLSGVHFALLIEKGKCMICDEGSTNDTFLHGIPIKGKGWMPTENKDKLRAGGYEYRVIIK